jgi:nucleolar MIF4G domain-containing protein 1
MSRRRLQRTGLKLPQQLQKELGLNDFSTNGPKGKFDRGDIARRQDRRKAERAGRKPARIVGHARRLDKPHKVSAAANEEPVEEVDSDASERPRLSVQPKSRKHPEGHQPQEAEPQERQLKSILKTRAIPAEIVESTSGSEPERSPSPGLVLDKSSKSFRDRAAQDDADIAALEKKLGVRAKRLPKSFDEDGLADLLEGIGSVDESRKRKIEELDWLERKRRRTLAEDDSDQDCEAFETEEDDGSDDSLLEEGSEDFESDKEDFFGFASADDDPAEQPAVRKRENPYVAPTSTIGNHTTKYIPPSLRKSTASENESLHRLQRQMQGQLNKLSEANLLSILAETEMFYQNHARQDVTSTLIDLLISLFCDPSVLQNTFVILHASFVAAVYKVVGTDFGAEFVSRLVHRFEHFHQPYETATGKQSVNLISILAHLYTFQVISSNLVFDHIRILLETLSETNAELLLRIVRDAGPQLRQDDPSALKDIVLLMQNSVLKAQAEGMTISVRTKFMIETITDLKNNKLRPELASSGVAGEHVTRMRKVLGTLNNRNIRASEPLRIGLDDVRNADKRGKWWLVGASWKEQDKASDMAPVGSTGDVNGRSVTLDGEESDLLGLARQHRMNTVVRRAIFIAIMSANDYRDAHLRLLKLRLKKSQQQEIPRVLMHCIGAEERYNPYYTLIAKTLCADKRSKMAFQFSLWDFFERIGENATDLDDDAEDDGTEVELKEIVNTARMFGSLVADGSLSLGILKTLSLPALKEKAMTFVEILLIVVISQSQQGAERARDEDALAKIFARCKDTPQVTGALRHFLKRVVRHSELTSSKAEARLVKWGCEVAIDTLKVVSSSSRGETV